MPPNASGAAKSVERGIGERIEETREDSGVTGQEEDLFDVEIGVGEVFSFASCPCSGMQSGHIGETQAPWRHDQIKSDVACREPTSASPMAI